MRFERAGAKQPRVVRFDHWGAPKAFGGSNLARSSEPLSSLPATAGGASWRVDRFHRVSIYSLSGACLAIHRDFSHDTEALSLEGLHCALYGLFEADLQHFGEIVRLNSSPSQK